MSIARKLSLRRNRLLVGRELDVLIEGRAEDGGVTLAVGRSYRDAPEVDGVVLLEALIIAALVLFGRAFS